VKTVIGSIRRGSRVLEQVGVKMQARLISMHFYGEIEAHRINKGMPVDEMCRYAGISRSAYYEGRNGNANVTLRVMVALASAVGMRGCEFQLSNRSTEADLKRRRRANA
jgi:transcriptional regulator with XRE-family HTH domain